MTDGVLSGLVGSVFVTGASGFIGSRLLPRLLDAHLPVRCLRLPGDCNPIPPGAAAATGDLADLEGVTTAMGDARIVFHLGGMASAALAQEHPHEAFRANTLGTQNVI